MSTDEARPVAGHVYTDEHGWAPIDEPQPMFNNATAGLGGVPVQGRTVDLADVIDEPDNVIADVIGDDGTIEGTVVAEHTEWYPAEREAHYDGPRTVWKPVELGPATAGHADTRWLPKVPELNPRRRSPDGDNPIFDELDARRETKTRKGWTKSKHRYRVRMTRWQEQHQLEEGAHRDRLWEIEHASPLLNQL